MEVLQKYKDLLPTLVLHSFTGTFEEAAAYLELENTYMAVSGMYLLSQNSVFRSVCVIIPSFFPLCIPRMLVA